MTEQLFLTSHREDIFYKMFFVSLYRITKFAWQNFWRNIWLSVITVFILVLTLFTISVLFTLNIVGDQAIKSVKEKVDIDLFFESEVAEDKIIATQAFLESQAEVKSVRYIGKDEALERFKEEHIDDPTIQEALDELEENPLSATLVVKAKEIESYPQIMVALDNSEYNYLIESRDFEDNQVVIDRLNTISDRIAQVGLIISALFALIAFLVVFNTIRVTIYTYREELGIMKLVGASNTFVRFPFVAESILYAVIASVVTIMIMYPLLAILSPYVNSFFQGYEFDMFAYFWQNFGKIFGLELLIALFLGVFSSMVAIGRYLRV